MSKDLNPQAVIHATNVIKARIEALRKLVATTPDGDEREAHKTELSGLLASIGLDGIGINITPAEDGANHGEGVATAILASVTAATAAAAKINEATGAKVEVTAKVETEEPGLWARFKAWCGENKKKVIAGGLALVAGAAGLWYWLTGKNTAAAVSSVADVDVTLETPVDTTVPAGDADPSIFTRIGTWFTSAADTVVGWAKASWTWVKGLFTSNNAAETTVETTVEVPATA